MITLLNLLFSTMSRTALLVPRRKYGALFSTRAFKQGHSQANDSKDRKMSGALKSNSSTSFSTNNQVPITLAGSTCNTTPQNMQSISNTSGQLNVASSTPLTFNYNYIDNPRISFKNDLLSVPLLVTSNFDLAMENKDNSKAFYLYMPGCFHQKLDYEARNRLRKEWHDYVVARKDVFEEWEYKIGFISAEVFDEYLAVSHEQRFAGTLHLMIAAPFDTVLENMYLSGYQDLVEWYMDNAIESMNRTDLQFREPEPFTSSEPQSEHRQQLITEGLRCIKINLEALRYTKSVMDEANYVLYKELHIQFTESVKAEALVIMEVQRTQKAGTYFTTEKSMASRMNSIGTFAFMSNVLDKNDYVVHESIRPLLNSNAVITVIANDLFSVCKETAEMPLNPFSMILKEIYAGLSLDDAFRKFNHIRNLAVREYEHAYESCQNQDQRSLMWKAGAYRGRAEHFYMSCGMRYSFKACYN